MPPDHSSSRHVRALARGVRARRKELGLTQEKLAEIAGMHRTYIGGIENANRNPTVEVLERLAAALQTDLGGLFEDVD